MPDETRYHCRKLTNYPTLAYNTRQALKPCRTQLNFGDQTRRDYDPIKLPVNALCTSKLPSLTKIRLLEAWKNNCLRFRGHSRIFTLWYNPKISMEREYLKEFVCSETIIPSENEEIKKEKFIKKNSWKIEFKIFGWRAKKEKTKKRRKISTFALECSKFSKEGQTKATRDKEKKKERKEKEIRKKRKWVQRSRVD